MQPGSLVVIKPFSAHVGMYVGGDIIKWLPKADEETIYTIRGRVFYPFTEEGWTFEEGVIGENSLGEFGLQTRYIREVQPPETIDIEAIIESSSPVEPKIEELVLEEF